MGPLDVGRARSPPQGARPPHQGQGRGVRPPRRPRRRDGVPVDAGGCPQGRRLPRADRWCRPRAARTYDPGDFWPALHRARTVGIVGAICAYNHPTLFTCMKMAPALMAGNALILKPAADPALPAGGGRAQRRSPPPGDLQRGRRRRGDRGRRSSPTPTSCASPSPARCRPGGGCTRVPRQSGQFKSVTLELGGKNPIVIYPDVDPASAAAAIIKGTNFARAGGQSCGATSRLPPARRSARRGARARGGRHGRHQARIPDDPATEMGYMVSHAHRDRVLSMIGDAREDGAHCWWRWPPGEPTGPRRRAFVEPTVFDGVDPRPGCSKRRCSVLCSA